MSQPCVYIIESGRNGRLYVGQTADMETRLAAHNGGLVKATRYLTPWRLVYTEACIDQTAARKREYRLKQLKSRKALEALIRSRLERPDEIGEVTGSSPVPPTIPTGEDEDE